MANITMRSTVFGLKEETTEGTPVAPDATTAYARLQPGFDMTPNVERLENAEFGASIAPGKAIAGNDNPSFSFAAYLRHSGTAGTAPRIAPVIKSLLGSQVDAAASMSTTSGSTTSSIAVTGLAASRQRGEAMLIQDPVNGFSLRMIETAATDAATPLFNVAAAPGSGVAIGRPNTFIPLNNTAHPSLSIWNYLGNGDAIQMAAGMKTVSMSLNATSGQLINMDFSLEGLGWYFNPIQITSATRYIDWENDDGTFAAAVAVKWYKTPYELAAALQSAMNAASTGETHTVSYSRTTGKFTISCTGTLLTLEFATGTNTANTIATKIGFAVADESGTGATTGYTSDNAQTYAAPHTPSYESADPLVAKHHEFLLGESAASYISMAPSSISINVTNARALPGDLSAESGRSTSAFTSRNVEIEVKALLSKYDAQAAYWLNNNATVRAQYGFGVKTGGNWTPGYCGLFGMPTLVVSDYDLEELDGFVSATIRLATFANATGQGEFYWSFV